MKVLLIEKNSIYFENGENSISFSDLDELKFYTGVDLTQTVGGKRVGYEPDRGIHTVFDGVKTLNMSIPFDAYEQLLSHIGLYTSRKTNPLYGLTGHALAARQRDLDESDIRATFEVESEAPVVTPFGTFNGGQDSAGYIHGAVGLAQALGEPDVTITDLDNVAHTMSFTDAMTVAALVGQQFRTAFLKKQAALVEIAGRVMA
jgi:hypothetical protein